MLPALIVLAEVGINIRNAYVAGRLLKAGLNAKKLYTKMKKSTKLILKSDRTGADNILKWGGKQVAREKAVELIIDNHDHLIDGVIEFIEEMTGVRVAELTQDELKHAFGRFGAQQLDEALVNKYGIEFPIYDLADETLPEQLGEWFADLSNEELSKRLGYEVMPFNSMFPPKEIPQQMDTFVSEGISSALGVQIDSVLNINSLKDDIIQALFNTIVELVNEALVGAKQEAATQIETALNNASLDYFPDGLPSEVQIAISSILIGVLESYALKLNDIIGHDVIKGKKFHYTPTQRLNARVRQRRRRKKLRSEGLKQVTLYVPSETAG